VIVHTSWAAIEANTGDSCAAFALKGLRIDALVTDVQLSGYISGLNVAETFRSLDPNPPVICASGDSIQNSRMVPGGIIFTNQQQNYWKRVSVCQLVDR
jgi:hypothetical protein